MKTKKPLDIWDKIDTLIADKCKPIQPDEFTMEMLSERIKSNGQAMSPSGLNNRVNKLLSDGVLSKRKTVLKGYQVNVYKFI